MKILVVDDHPMLAKGFVELLNLQGYEASYEEVNYDALVLSIQRMQLVEDKEDSLPIILLDIQFGKLACGESGIIWTRKLLESFPEIKIILMTGLDYPALYDEMKDCGAKALILKTCEEEEFIETIERVFHGEDCFPTENVRPEREILNQLKGSHRRILQMIADGKKGEEIAMITSYSLRSVRTRVEEAHTIFQASSNAEMIAKAIALGIVKVKPNR